MTTTKGTEISLLRLMQLVSPSLPVGAYSFSEGMECAIEDAWVDDEVSTNKWISGLLIHNVGCIDIPLFARIYDAWLNDDQSAIRFWTDQVLARRETKELREQDVHLGQALAKVLHGLGLNRAQPWSSDPCACFLNCFALASVEWGIDKETAASGYLWTWLENQVLAAIKSVPLGQQAGQQLLFKLSTLIPDVVKKAMAMNDCDMGSSCMSVAIASSRHETQYTRLFRS